MANKGSYYSRSDSAGSPLPQRPTELLHACEQDLTRHLIGYIRPALEETNDELFDEAHKSASTQAQNRLFEAMNAFKSHRESLGESLAEEIAKHFADFIQSGPLDDDGQEHAGAQEMSLVADHELVEDLAITQMVSKAEIRNTQALYALNQRMAVLNRGRAVINAGNPCGPHQIGAALRTAIDTIDVAASEKVKFFHAFDRQLQQRLPECYTELNEKLIEEGILPNLKLDVRKTPARPPPAKRPAQEAPPEQDPASDAQWPDQQPGFHPPPTSGQPASPWPSAGQAAAQSPAGAYADSAPPQQGYDHGPPQHGGGSELDFFGRATSRSIGTTAGSHVNAELIRDIRKLLNQVSPPPPIPRRVTVAEPTRLQQALSSLQSQLAREPHDASRDLLSSEEVKQLLARSLGRDHASGKNTALSKNHSQTIDIVGMLYDHIKEEQLLHEPVQKLLKRLQVPMIRAALEEEEFFDDTDHPARRLFNTIADAGELWLDDRPEGSATFNKMQIAVDRILTDYQDDLNVFKELLGDLDKHIATLSRKAKVTEKRAVEKLRGQEKLELARDRARTEMERLIEKYEPPRFVESLLEHPWTDFLALTALRYGNQDEHWKEALTAAKTLIFSVRKGLSEDVRAKLRQRVPWLRKKVTEGLSQVGYFEQDIEVVLGNLETCHQWSLAPTAEARAAAQTQPKSRAPAARKPTAPAPSPPRDQSPGPAPGEAPGVPAEATSGPRAKAVPESAQPAQAAEHKPAPEVPETETAWEDLDFKEVALSGLAQKQQAAGKKATADSSQEQQPAAEPEAEPAAVVEVLHQPIPGSAAHKARPESVISKRKAALPKLNAAQKEMLAKIRLLSFGTWFELMMGDSEGLWVKRKLSWYSPLTGRCLFVNNRGAMAEEMNMHQLAIAMADKRARIYEPQSKPLIDRAFQTIFTRLRGLVDRVAPA